jgi:hypothetical protein
MKLSTGITKTAAGNMKSRGGAPLAWMKTSREQNQRKTKQKPATNRVLSRDALRSDDIQTNQNELHNDTIQKEVNSSKIHTSQRSPSSLPHF